jgi:integrase
VLLNSTTIKALALEPGVRERTFWDDAIPGFGVRLRASGAASYIVQFDIAGKSRKVTLGPLALVSLGAARAKAKETLAKVKLGHDPAADRQAQRLASRETFGSFLPTYLAGKQAELRKGSQVQLAHRLNGLAEPLHALPVSTIDRRAISGLLATVATASGSSAALNLHSGLCGYFEWLFCQGLVDDNVMLAIKRPAAGKKRERVLTDDELRALWRALGDDDYGAIVRLLVYTGCRRDEIGSLPWSEVDLERAVIEIPAARMKGKKPHVVMLSPAALAVLQRRSRDGRAHVFGQGAGGFNSWSGARRALDARLGGSRPDWTLHDLRRTVSTRLNDELGVAPWIVEAILAHAKKGMEATYNRASYLEERRRAMVRWAGYVETLVTGEVPVATVVRLRPGA